jgi:4-amino-4-deoxy-L-arabinose transferase-like glycosyltransferase
MLDGDPVDYNLHAVSIAAGHGYPPTAFASPGTPSAFRPPGYPFLLGGAYALFGSKVLVGRLVGAALGVLTVLLIASVGRMIGGRRTGLIAGAISAVFLPLIALNGTLLSESLFVPVELALLLCVLRFRRDPSFRWALLAGALCALAALTRAVADLWMIPVLLAIGTGARPARLRWASVAAALAAFVVLLAPWTIRNAEAFHAFVPISTESGFTLAGQYNQVAGPSGAFEAVWQTPTQVPQLTSQLKSLIARPGGITEAGLDGVFRRDGISYLKHHPFHLVVATVLDTLRLVDLGQGHQFTTGVGYDELSLPEPLRDPTTWSSQLIVLLALLGLVARGLRQLRFPVGPWWLWTIPLLTYLTTVPAVGNPVKRIPLDPFFILLAALMLVSVADRYRHSRGQATSQDLLDRRA